jgi:hypothetical protein
MLTLSNPCAGVKRHKETGRDRYVEDAEFTAVWEKACQPVKDALELYLLTGQRVSDVLKLYPERCGEISGSAGEDPP